MLLNLAFSFILIISLVLFIFPVNSIFIFLGAICTFLIGSLVLFQTNHTLIGSVFLIVYVGAILVFICISLLLSPAIRSSKNNAKLLDRFKLRNFKIDFFIIICFCFIILLIYYLVDSNPRNLFEINILQLQQSNRNSQPFTIFDMFVIFEIHLTEFLFATEKFNNFMEVNMNFLLADSFEFECQNNTNNYFEISFFDLNNDISKLYKNDFFLIFTIGIYLFIILICCLILFSINHEKRIIKRQDSVDQILKKWI